MRKFATLALATAALSLTASAATITSNCTLFPIQFANGSGSGSISCPGFSAAGGILSGASLSLFADYTFGSAGANDIKVTFTVGAPASVTWASSSLAIDVTGGFNSSGSTPAVPATDAATAGATNANFASAFNIGVSSQVISGSAGTSSGGAQITYTYGFATPEPGSIALLGSGLIGLAIVGRKRFSR